MSLISATLEAVNKRGATLIVRIKQDLKSSGKSAGGTLISDTKGETRIVGSAVVFEGKAPEHYIFVDKGRKPNSKPPPVKPIDAWIKKKGLDLNAFAVAKSIGKKGIKATNIYSDNVDKFIKELNLSDDLRPEIIKDIKQSF